MASADYGAGVGPDDEPPFESAWSRKVFDRATLLARGLFPCAESVVALVKDGQVWRSRERYRHLGVDRAGERVVASGELLWIEDGRCDPRFADDPLVTGEPHLRGYVGAPIKLADGSVPGVLSVHTTFPLPYDAAGAARLEALAAFVADEWARARAADERERAAQALEETRATQRALLSSLPISISLTDRELRVIAATRVWERNLGLEGKDYTGLTLFELAPGIYEPHREVFERVLAGEHVSGPRVPVPRGGGRLDWMKTETTPWRDRSGEIGGLIIVADNVNELVAAVDRSERAEQRLNLALELADLHVWEVDYQTQELFKAGAEASFYEQPQTFESLSTDAFSTVDERDRERVREAWRRHAEQGAPYRPQYRVARADGQEVWVEGVAQLYSRSSGEPRRLLAVMRNVSERKQAEARLVQAREEAEAANRAKSTFLATMSHEIRTPLNGVLGMAQAMAADELCPRQRQRLDVVRQSGEALLAILNDVLDLSKIEAGKLVLEEAEFEIDDLARTVHDAFSAIASEKGVGFRLSIDSEASGAYRGDATRVRQILANLVSNALKFTDEGEVKIDVSHAPPGLRLIVQDSGIGIAAEHMPHLFAKFEQADASTTRRYGGTGLGLAICRDLAELMGGAIRAFSKPGEGTAFCVTLPLVKLDHAASAPSAGAAANGAASIEGGALRVLAAEDNAVNQLVLKTLLQQVGVEPVLVANGQEAVEAWARETWDMILMDIQMPVMDGPTASRIIRERETAEGRTRTPIIALTANAMSHQVAEYRALGMDGFVAKPIQVSELFEAMNRVAVDGLRVA